MEQDFLKDHFEQLLTDKAGEYKMYPSEQVWNKIYRRMHTRKRWHFIGGSTFALLITSALFLLVHDQTEHNPAHQLITQKHSLQQETAQLELLASGRKLISYPETHVGKFTPILPSTFLPIDPIQSSDFASLTPLAAPLKSADLSSDPNSQHLHSAKETIADNTISTIIAPDLPNDSISLRQPLSLIKVGNDALTRNPLNKANPVGLPGQTAKNLHSIQRNSKWSWKLYFAPSISYRTLRTEDGKSPNSGYIVVNNNSYNINQLVNQQASVGFEIGGNMLLAVTKQFRLKAGLQFNFSRYTARAYNTAHPENASIELNGTTTNTITNYRNYTDQSNNSTTWIPNQRIQISIPVGVEMQVLGNDRVNLNVAGSFQPSYTLNAKTYLLSSNYKNYVQEPTLLRKWNMNVEAETFLRINRGAIQWQIGPQIRYQLLPSYNGAYPVKEHIYDIGLKIGIIKRL